MLNIDFADKLYLSPYKFILGFITLALVAARPIDVRLHVMLQLRVKMCGYDGH